MACPSARNLSLDPPNLWGQGSFFAVTVTWLVKSLTELENAKGIKRGPTTLSTEELEVAPANLRFALELSC